MTSQALVSEIESAFADVACPGPSEISSSQDEMGADFAGKHWKEIIHPSFLNQHRTFGLFTTEGLVYYLPAYMIGAILFPEVSKEWTVQCLGALYPEAWEKEGMQQWAILVDSLTPRQKRCIRLFLEYLHEAEGDRWETFEPPFNLLKAMLFNYWQQF